MGVFSRQSYPLLPYCLDDLNESLKTGIGTAGVIKARFSKQKEPSNA